METNALDKLSANQIITFLDSLNGKEFKEACQILLEYRNQSIQGKSIPNGIYRFIVSNYFSSYINRAGVKICSHSGEILNDDNATKVYSGYASYINKEPSFVNTKYLKGLLETRDYVFDEILNEVFQERKTTVFDENFDEKTIANSHASFKVDAGEYFSSQVTRHKRIYTTFKTNFYGYGHSPKNWVIPEGDTYGVEIEMLFPSLKNKLMFSSWVGQNYPGWACEYDGSLEDVGNAGDCGLELISPPLLFGDICSQVTEICNRARELDGKGFQAGIYYGMHITVQIPKGSRNGPNRQTIGSRYIAFFNLPVLRPFWQLVARRKGESFVTYCPFKDVELETCLGTERGEHDRHPHRRAVFVRNQNLLETRIFRSNLSDVQVRANIEICKLVMEFCQSKEFDMNNLKIFYDFLQKHMSKDLRACLYRKKNTPIKALNEIALESEINNEPDYQFNS